MQGGYVTRPRPHSEWRSQDLNRGSLGADSALHQLCYTHAPSTLMKSNESSVMLFLFLDLPPVHGASVWHPG